MGFLNKFLKGLGFEDDETEEKPQKSKQKKEKVKSNVTASFNLGKDDLEEKPKQKQKEEKVREEPENTELQVIKVKSQTEVQSAIKKIKNGGRVLINIEGLSREDMIRSLDFLSGAVYALELSIQKIDDKIYLIQ